MTYRLLIQVLAAWLILKGPSKNLMRESRTSCARCSNMYFVLGSSCSNSCVARSQKLKMQKLLGNGPYLRCECWEQGGHSRKATVRTRTLPLAKTAAPPNVQCFPLSLHTADQPEKELDNLNYFKQPLLLLRSTSNPCVAVYNICCQKCLYGVHHTCMHTKTCPSHKQMTSTSLEHLGSSKATGPSKGTVTIPPPGSA